MLRMTFLSGKTSLSRMTARPNLQKVTTIRSVSAFSKHLSPISCSVSVHEPFKSFEPSSHVSRRFYASTNPPSQENHEEGFEEHQESIYKGILATQIKLVKSFSLLTSVIGLSCQPVLFMKMGEGTANLPLIVGTGAFLSFFTFATPLLIHWISKKYVIELLYNKIDDTYTAVTFSLLLRKKEVKFKISDVQVPELPGMFTTFKANNVPLFVDGHQFKLPVHYGKIMGHDKPLNLYLDDEQQTVKKKSS